MFIHLTPILKSLPKELMYSLQCCVYSSMVLTSVHCIHSVITAVYKSYIDPTKMASRAGGMAQRLRMQWSLRGHQLRFQHPCWQLMVACNSRQKIQHPHLAAVGTALTTCTHSHSDTPTLTKKKPFLKKRMAREMKAIEAVTSFWDSEAVSSLSPKVVLNYDRDVGSFVWLGLELVACLPNSYLSIHF